jgi:hypothetical protein
MDHLTLSQSPFGLRSDPGPALPPLTGHEQNAGGVPLHGPALALQGRSQADQLGVVRLQSQGLGCYGAPNRHVR